MSRNDNTNESCLIVCHDYSHSQVHILTLFWKNEEKYSNFCVIRRSKEKLVSIVSRAFSASVSRNSASFISLRIVSHNVFGSPGGTRMPFTPFLMTSGMPPI